MKIGGIGHYLIMCGSMDDLHNFMCATTNPTATSNMAYFLVLIAKTREDALKLLTCTSSWVGQAEERAVNDILLRKAGSILGATALDMLNERSAQGQPQEFSELISGIAEKDPVAVRSWLELNRSSLSQDAVSRVLFQISSNTNSTDLLSNENIRLLRGPDDKIQDQYLNAVVGGLTSNMNDTQTTINNILSNVNLSELQKQQQLKL